MLSLTSIYEKLFAQYGDLHWWPAESPFEVMVGAILTQNTAWGNVEKALQAFQGDLSPKRILGLPQEKLQAIIRPAGFYRQKAQYLKAISRWFSRYHFRVEEVQRESLASLRKELLEVRGVGQETADSILLYAFHFPTFVVDAYTMRLFRRFPIHAGQSYREVKSYCEEKLPRDRVLFQHFHALLVQNGKDHCKTKPSCVGCPLEEDCRKILT